MRVATPIAQPSSPEVAPEPPARFDFALDPKNPRLGPAKKLAKLSQWELIQCALELDLPGTGVVFIGGPPGIGKTYSAYHHGRLGNRFYAITITEETSAAEVRGHFILKGNEAVWHDGPFVMAMRVGARLVVNEISNANSDVLAIMMPIFESPKTAELTLPTGETLRPAPGFHVVITDNRGIDELPDALDDRVGSVFWVNQPHPDALMELHPDLRELAIATAALDDERRISLRGWLSLQGYIPDFGLEAACILTFGPDRGPLVHDVIVMRNHRDTKPASKSKSKKGRGRKSR